jgi:transposase
MSKRQKTEPRTDQLPRPARAPFASLQVLHPDAAGIDVHSDLHLVCVPAGRDAQPIRSFGANSCDLAALADWLRQCGVTTVAMESTGVYWIPLFELLEARGFAVSLVEPGQLSHCGARPKTDVLDVPWSQRLHSYGLLRPSFRPPESVLALRGYQRQRPMLVRYAASHVQHMQKALEQMNVKLAEVVADSTGVTGRSIIEAILQGERDPKVLAARRQTQCHNDAETIARALEGTWRPEHLFALKQAYELYRFHHQQISACDARIREELARQPNRAPDHSAGPQPRQRGRKNNDLRFDAVGPLFRALGADLTEIEGIDVGTALVILAEIGVDVSRFPTEKHFASWLGLCPREARSNKTAKKQAPRKGKNRVAVALRMAAQASSRTKSPGGVLPADQEPDRGKGAVAATAHKLARLVYRILKYGRDYVKQSMQEYAAKQKENLERALRRKAAALGFEVVPKGTTAEAAVPT